MYINFEDYKKEDGSIDWKRYDEAKVLNGQKCYKCGSYISSVSNSGFKSLCYECKNLETNTEEVNHSNLIRCPSCRYSWDLLETSDYDFYTDGEHNVECPECEFEFEIVTHVSYSFDSPELIKNDEEEEQNETANSN